MFLITAIINYLKGDANKNHGDLKVMVIVPPDGGYSWLIVAASFYVNFVLDGCMFSYSVYLKPIQIILNISETEGALIGSMFQGVYYFSGPFTSMCVNRIGFRLTSIIGSMCLIVGFMASAYINNFIGFLVTYGIIGGLGAGLCYTPSVIIVSYHFERYRALATGLAMSGSAVGALVLSIVFEAIVTHYGLFVTLLVQCGLGVSTLIAAVIYRYPSGTEVVIDDVSNNLFGTLLDDKSKEDEDFRHLLRKSIYGGPQDDKQLRSAISMTNFRQRYRSAMNDSIDNVETKKCSWLSCMKCKCLKCNPSESDSIGKKITTRPLDRKDIFLHGSMADFSEIVSQRSEHVVANQTEHGCCYEFFNPQLFKSIPYICAVLALVTYTLAASVPYMFVVDRSVQNGMSFQIAKNLLPTISFGNMIGRFLSGVVSFFPIINSRYLVTVTVFLVGVITIASALISTNNVYINFVYAFLTGILLAFSPTLRTLSYVLYVGMDLLTTAFGVGLLFAGVAAVTGTPIAGLLKDRTGSYQLSFIFSGVNLVLSAIFTIVAEIVYLRSIK